MAYARRYCRELDKTKEEEDAIIKEMTSSDYDNLVSVFDNHFGEFVDLIMP